MKNNNCIFLQDICRFTSSVWSSMWKGWKRRVEWWLTSAVSARRHPPAETPWPATLKTSTSRAHTSATTATLSSTRKTQGMSTLAASINSTRTAWDPQPCPNYHPQPASNCQHPASNCQHPHYNCQRPHYNCQHLRLIEMLKTLSLINIMSPQAYSFTRQFTIRHTPQCPKVKCVWLGCY